MADTKIIKLADELDKARDRLFELASKTRNKERKAELSRQMRKLSKQIRRLISMNIKKHGKEYQAATAAMTQANRKLRKAIEDSQKIADAIEVMAFALDAASKIKPG